MANTTWNPSDKSANVTLSGGNLIATASSATAGGVRTVDRQTSGKYYWEITLTTLSGAATGVGIAASGVSLGSNPTITPGISAIIKSGHIYVNGVDSAISLGALVSGNLIGIALDAGNMLIWYRLGAAGNWNNSGTANPATGIGSLNLAPLGVIAYYPTGFLNATSDALTANFGDSAFTGTVPSGFASGFPLGTPANIAVDTQTALEQWMNANAQAQLTQIAVEQWGLTGAVGTQALATQVALEEWARSPSLAASAAMARAMVLA